MKGESVLKVAGQLGFLTDIQIDDLVLTLNPTMEGEVLISHLTQMGILDEGRGEILLRQLLLLEKDAADAATLVKGGKLSALGSQQALNRQRELLPREYVSLRSLLKERGVTVTLDEDPESLRDEADVRLARFLLSRNAIKIRDLMRALDNQREHGPNAPPLSKVLVRLGILQSSELNDATSRLSMNSIAGGPASIAGGPASVVTGPAQHASVAELNPAQLRLLLGDEQEEKVAEKMVQSAILNRNDLEDAIKERKATGKNLSTILLGKGAIKEEEINTASQEVLQETSRPLGKYQLVRPLGEGGAGTVFLAFDTVLNRPVALKLLSKAVGPFADRFKQEAQVAARLDHPNIARIYEFGEAEGMPYLALQYIDGKTADSSMKLPVRDRAEVMRTISEAVHYAHQRGIVHRDIKPANIMIDAENRPYLLDFGLARPVDVERAGAGRLTIDGAILGTPPFMAPEQARGDQKEVDALSDVYGLAATLYYLLVGKPPIEKATTLDTLKAVEEEEPMRPRRIDPKIPPELDNVVMKGLEKDKSRRYATAKDLADDLKRFLDGEAVMAVPPSTIYLLVKKFRKRKLAFSLAGLLVVAMGAAGGIFLAYRYSDAQRTLAEKENKWKEELDRAAGAVEAFDLKKFESGKIDAADREKLASALGTCGEIAAASTRPQITAAAHALSSRIYQMIGKPDAAMKEIEQAIALTRDARYIHRRAALLLSESGSKSTEEVSARVEKARKDLEDSLRSGSLSPEQAAYAKIRLAEDSADLDEIAKLCERYRTSAGAENPRLLAEALKLEGEIRLKRGDAKGALARLQEASKLKPGDAYLWYLLAYARFVVYGGEFRTTTDPEELARPILEDLGRSLELDPDAAPALSLGGRVQLEISDALRRGSKPAGRHPEQAFDLLTLATQRGPKLPDAWEGLGDACLLGAELETEAGKDPRPKLKSAQGAFQEAIAVKPSLRAWTQSAVAWLREARHLLRTSGDPDPALATARTQAAGALAIDSASPAARISRMEADISLAGRQLAAGGDPASLVDEALGDLAVTLTLQPDSIPVLRMGARANFLKARREEKTGGNPRPALQETQRFLSQCLDADSKDAGVLEDRVDVWLMLADLEKPPTPMLESAEKDLTAVFNLRPADTALLSRRAAVRLRLGNASGALDDLERRLAAAAEDGEALGLRVESLIKLAAEPNRPAMEVLGYLRRADQDLTTLLKPRWEAKRARSRAEIRSTLARMVFDAGADAGEPARAAKADLDELLKQGAPEVELLRSRARIQGILAFQARRSLRDPGPDLAGAVEDYDAALKGDPARVDLREDRGAVLLMLAEVRAAKGDDATPLLDRARADFTAANKDHPSAPAYLNLGNLEVLAAQAKMAKNEDPAEALKAASANFLKAVALDGTLSDAYGALGIVLVFQGRAELLHRKDPSGFVREAVKRLGKAIDLAPTHAPYFRSRAAANLLLAEHEEAEGRDPEPTMKLVMDDFSTALKLGQDDGQTYRDLGQAFAMQARMSARKGENPADVLRKAIENIEKSGGSEADRLLASARIRQDIGKIRQESGQDPAAELSDAIRDYHKAAELGVSDDKVQENLGLAHYLRAKHYNKSGKDALPDLELADQSFRKLSDADPKAPAPWLNQALVGHLRAQIFRTANRTEEAAKEFRRTADLYSKAIGRDERLAEAWSGRGLVNIALGQKEQAKADLERAIKIDPRLEPSLRQLLKTFGEKGK